MSTKSGQLSSAIKASKLEEDLTFPLLDPLISFDFVDDWIVDNDMSLVEEEAKLDFDDVKVGSLIESLNIGDAPSKNEVVEDVHSAEKVDYECLDELKEKDNGEVVGEELKENEGKENEEDGKAESREMSREDEDSRSSSEDESESEDGSEDTSSSSSSEEEEVDGSVDFEDGEIKNADLEEMLADSDHDELAVKGPIKSKNEMEFLPHVPPVDVKLEPHHQALPVGVVLSIMDAKVVVEGLERHNPLNEGSILWVTESRSPLGIVDEIFGPVKNPYYIVRYNSDQEIPAGICHGIPVSFVADFADHVLNDKNLYKKGYDASGENDEEISDEAEFSDDEKEAEYRRSQKMVNKSANDRKRGNQEFVARKKVQQNGSWKNTQPPAQALAKHTGQTNSHSRPQTPPVEQSFSGGSTSSSFSPRPVGTGRPSPTPPSSQVAHANAAQKFVPPNDTNFCAPQNFAPANGGWPNGMPGQPQHQMLFPNGYPMNGMPFQPLNPYQQAPQMFNNFPGGMLFQQQFDPSQMMMHNMPSPYGQMSFPPKPSTPWQWHPGQSNPGQFGVGLQGQQMQPVNAGNQQGTSHGPNNVQSAEMLPPSNMQGNFSCHHQQNQGRPPPASNIQGNFRANPGQFGTGLQGQQMRPPVNAGNQQGTSHGQNNVQSTEMPPPSNMQGDFSAHHQQNQGRPPSASNMQGNFPAHQQQQNHGRPPARGGRSYHRGGGRSSGRRGRG